jgi:RNA polymerase II C-terminal domain phosphatase-like 3/4
MDFMHMMTKLRPIVHTFLKEASEMFEMYIYTMGDRAYALEMAKLLDPQREYFSARVISRDDGTHRHQKGLDVVLGQESAVLILDDTENVSTFAISLPLYLLNQTTSYSCLWSTMHC